MSIKRTTIDFYIRQNWHKIQRMYNQKAQESDISLAMGYVLLAIDKAGTPSTQLGPKMGMEPTSLSRTLKSMESEGLIRREIDSKDKRKVFIFLTPKGVEKRKKVRDVVVEFDNRLTANIPQEKLDVYFEVMQQLDELIDVELKNNLNKAEC